MTLPRPSPRTPGNAIRSSAWPLMIPRPDPADPRRADRHPPGYATRSRRRQPACFSWSRRCGVMSMCWLVGGLAAVALALGVPALGRTRLHRNARRRRVGRCRAQRHWPMPCWPIFRIPSSSWTIAPSWSRPIARPMRFCRRSSCAHPLSFALRSPDVLDGIDEVLTRASPCGSNIPSAFRPSAPSRSISARCRRSGRASASVGRRPVLPRPDLGPPARGDAGGFRRQCEPRAAHAAGLAPRLHRDPAGPGPQRPGGAGAVSGDHARRRPTA